MNSARSREKATPEQILDLKVCDLAVGSAAFLVETCRQLGDALVSAWERHGNRPPLPDDETEELETTDAAPGGAKKPELDTEVDSLLDEIDDVLETNAEEFVRSFVQKGGQ